MVPEPRREAQRRADRVRAFREELAQLKAEGASPLTSDQEATIAAHHGRLLADLSRVHDVDRTLRAGHLSRGMRLTSWVGAAAMLATMTTLVERFWAGFSLPAQVTLLCAWPLAALAGVQLAADRDRARHLAGLFAVVACGAAWVAIALTARLLDIPFSSLLLWPGAAFGVAVAMSYGFRVALAPSLILLLVALASLFFVAAGVPWTAVFDRLEPLTATAFVLVVVAPHVREAGDGFESTTRLTGLAVGLGGLLALASIRGVSLLAFAPGTTLIVYQVVTLLVCVVTGWRRLAAGDTASVTVVTVAFGLFLLVRYVDWFWEALPAWAFFLGLALAALGGLTCLRRARRRLEAA